MAASQVDAFAVGTTAPWHGRNGMEVMGMGMGMGMVLGCAARSGDRDAAGFRCNASAEILTRSSAHKDAHFRVRPSDGTATSGTTAGVTGVCATAGT